MTVDYKLLDEVLRYIQDLAYYDDSDEDSRLACSRCASRKLAEAVGLPLAPFRLLMEKEVRPMYRKDYELAEEFRDDSSKV